MEKLNPTTLEQEVASFKRPKVKSKTTKSNSKLYCEKIKAVYDRDQFYMTPMTRNTINYFKWKFNNPQSAFKIVHVAGTNGKGSVSIKTHSLLASSGFKTGLFTTPSIASLREVIKINNQMISETDFCKFYDIVEKFEEEWKVKSGYFQFMLAMAILYFKDQKCDYVVLECGVGGFRSQTNFFDSNYAAITSIGFDHVDVLGKLL